jgi:hypothetical protein
VESGGLLPADGGAAPHHTNGSDPTRGFATESLCTQQLCESPPHVGVSHALWQVRVTSPKVTRAAVDPAAAAALTAALEANAPYRVRVPTSVFGGSPGRWAISSLPLRCLVHSDLQESFVLHLDDLGNIAALDYSTPSGECLVEEVLPPTKCAPSTSTARRRSPSPPKARTWLGSHRVTPAARRSA